MRKRLLTRFPGAHAMGITHQTVAGSRLWTQRFLTFGVMALCACGGNKAAEKKDAPPAQDKAAAPANPEHCTRGLANANPDLMKAIKEELAALPDAEARGKRFEAAFFAACKDVAPETLACATPEGAKDCAALTELVAKASSAASWVDAAAAASLPADKRCADIWALAGPKAAKEMTLAPEKAAAFDKHVLAGCAALTPEDLACVEKGSHFDACEPFMAVLKKSATQPDVIDPKELEAMQLKAAQSEATVTLKALSNAVTAYHAQSKKLPGAIPAAPAGDCCKQPDGKCAVNAAEWQAKPWKDLGFAVSEPGRYHFSVVVKGKGKKATLALRAEGDPTCKGTKDAWEMQSTVGADGALKFGEAAQVP